MGIQKRVGQPRMFNLFFEWFSNYSIIKKGFESFPNDSEVMASLFEFMKELMDHKTHRLKFEAQTMTGFRLFKEISELTVTYYKNVENSY